MDSELVRALRDLIEAADACSWSVNTSVMDDAIAKERGALAAHDAREGGCGESCAASAGAKVGELIGTCIALSHGAARPQPRVTDEMVTRFLGWRLPDTFAPDCCISFDREAMKKMGNGTHWPVGTNLFTDPEARAMLEYVLAARQPQEQ